MPTLGEACQLLRISRRTLEKWLERLQIAPQRHEYDLRYQVISAEDVERIRAARAAMPGMETYQGYGFSPHAPRTTYTRHRDSKPAFNRRESGEATYTDTSASAHGGTSLASDAFSSHADAARWVVEHGVNSPLSPKSWPGWREVELTPRAVLMLMLRVYQPGNWRQQWRPRRCGRAECVCQELLPAAPDAPGEQTF